MTSSKSSQQTTTNPDLLITVIIPVYNVERYLRPCVDSILGQTHKSLEIYLIDDGSSDNCPQICDEYASGDSRIKVIHQDNAGVSAARNVGIESASGQYIAFVDADDWVDSDYLSKLLTIILTNHADVACCELFLARPNHIAQIAPYSSTDRLPEKADAIDLFLNYCTFSVCKLYDRQTALVKARFDTGSSHTEDTRFIMEVLKSIEVVAYTNEPLYYYRQRKGSAIFSVSNNQHAIESRQAFLDYLDRQITSFPHAKPAITKRKCKDIYDIIRETYANPEMKQFYEKHIPYFRRHLKEFLPTQTMQTKIFSLLMAINYHASKTAYNQLKPDTNNNLFD